MEDEMIQSNVLMFVLFGGMVSLGCSNPERPASDASRVNSPNNTGPDITTGPGAGEPTDSTPDPNDTRANPDLNDSRSTGSSGPDMGPSTAAPSVGPTPTH